MSLHANNALVFYHKTFALTESLKNDFRFSSNPIVVLVVGPARSGKSTLCNILLKPEIPTENREETFPTDEGNTPVTMQIQYVRISLKNLLKIHGINVQLQTDSDIFLFDCEGIDSLGDVTESLRKAIFTFLQISTINIFVTKNIDRSNIYDLKSFFTLPQMICESHQLVRGSLIVLTDNGVPGNPKESEYEEKRRRNDKNELTKVLSHLKSRQINFSEKNIALFAQPKWAKAKHYFESIKDLIKFVLMIVQNRIPIPGSTLIQIFEKCIPIISQIDELDDPDIRLEVIINHLINEYFKNSYDLAIQQFPIVMKKNMKDKEAQELIELSNRPFIEPIKEEIRNIFIANANNLYPNITQYFADKKDEYLNLINKTVQQLSIKDFEKKCKKIVIPFVANQVLNEMNDTISHELGNQQNNNQSNVTNLIQQYQKRATDLFNRKLKSVSNNLISTPNYNSQLKVIHWSIYQHIELIEQNKRITKLDHENQELTKNLNELKNIIKQLQRNSHVGSFFFSARCEDKLPGALKCNGQIVNVSEYPEFVANYLKTKLVDTVSIKEWKEKKNLSNNVGFFGYDVGGGSFIAPFIPSGTFLSNASVDSVNGCVMSQGNFANDQIVNITGDFNWNNGGQGQTEITTARGAFKIDAESFSRYPDPGGYSTHCRGLSFDASRMVKTGDRVMPRTIFHNLYVVIC